MVVTSSVARWIFNATLCIFGLFFFLSFHPKRFLAVSLLCLQGREIDKENLHSITSSGTASARCYIGFASIYATWSDVKFRIPNVPKFVCLLLSQPLLSCRLAENFALIFCFAKNFVVPLSLFLSFCALSDLQ